MAALDQSAIDAIIEYGLDLRRFETGTRQNVIAILERMQKELVAALANSGEMSEFSIAKREALLKQVREILNRYYATAQGELALTTQGLGEVQAAQTGKLIEATLAAKLGASVPTAPVLERLAKHVLIEGGPLADWWDKLSADASFKLTNAIRQGIAQGEDNQTIIRRVIGKRGVPGIMELSRAHAAAVVQTAVQSIAADARLRTLEMNADVVPKIRWVSALDNLTCPICAELDGKEWTNIGVGQPHEPIGDAPEFANVPRHFNCRCAVIGVPKTFKELGINAPEPKPGQRASMTGPVPANTTFKDWFARRTPQQQAEQFGVGKAKMYREGKITLDQLVSDEGRVLTLKELKEKYG